MGGIRTSISIVEDSKEYQHALVNLIIESKDFQLDRVFSSAEEALPCAEKLKGILIIDIKLPGMNGAKFVHEFKKQNKDVQCIICSMYDDDEFIFTALKNGALGYLLKDSTPAQILAALDELLQGGAPMSPYIARRVIASFQPRKEDAGIDRLTDRELEVLTNLSQGLQYKEIGEKLSISAHTVKQHIKKIYNKLHVQNKVEALNKLRNS